MTKEVLKLALEALEPLVRRAAPWGELDRLNGCKAIAAIKEALAQSEQEQDGCPVCGSDLHDRDALDKAEREIERLRAWVKFTPPPQRKPLTDEDVERIIKSNMSLQMNLAGIRADFETAHGIKD